MGRVGGLVCCYVVRSSRGQALRAVAAGCVGGVVWFAVAYVLWDTAAVYAGRALHHLQVTANPFESALRFVHAGIWVAFCVAFPALVGGYVAKKVLRELRFSDHTPALREASRADCRLIVASMLSAFAVGLVAVLSLRAIQ